MVIPEREVRALKKLVKAAIKVSDAVVASGGHGHIEAFCMDGDALLNLSFTVDKFRGPPWGNHEGIHPSPRGK